MALGGKTAGHWQEQIVSEVRSSITAARNLLAGAHVKATAQMLVTVHTYRVGYADCKGRRLALFIPRRAPRRCPQQRNGVP